MGGVAFGHGDGSAGARQRGERRIGQSRLDIRAWALVRDFVSHPPIRFLWRRSVATRAATQPLRARRNSPVTLMKS